MSVLAASRQEMASRQTIQVVDLGDDDENPLSVAIEMGNLSIVERCLKDGWPLTSENKMGYTPLQQAASDGQVEISNFLLRKGADPNAKNKWGLTALHRAAHNGHSDLVMLLLENGADVELANDGGNSALHWAAYFGHYQVCTMLLTEGADPLFKNTKGITPLEHAKSRKKLKCERILRSYAEGKMKPRKRISKVKKAAPKQVIEQITDEDLAQVESKATIITAYYSETDEPTFTEVIDLQAPPAETVEESAPGEEAEEEADVVPVAVVVTEGSPEDVEEKAEAVEGQEDVGCGTDEVVAPWEDTEEAPPAVPKMDVGDIGAPPDPLDLEELKEEPAMSTLLPLRSKRMNHLNTHKATPRMTPNLRFTPAGTPGPPGTAGMSRTNSNMSMNSEKTVVYRNIDNTGNRLYTKGEVSKKYKDDHTNLCLEMTALKAENLQLIKEGDVLTSEIQRLNVQWKTVRHENETVKYTVKEVMKENEELKSQMGNSTLKMNKMNVDIDRLLSDNNRLSRENKKLNQDLMKELHFFKSKHEEEKNRAESLAISLQEQKKLVIDLQEQLILPPEERPKLKEECEYRKMVLDFIRTLNIPEPFQVPKFTKCFCKECCPDPHLEYRGCPLMMYAVPQGYVRFGLAADPRLIEHGSVFEKNHVSFYPIHPSSIRDMIGGGLQLPGSATPAGDKLPTTAFHQGKFSIVPDNVEKPHKNPHRQHYRSEFRHPEKCNCGNCQDFLPGNFFFTSPTIKYIEHLNYKPYWVKYQGKMVRCAFQVRQKQDAYNILWRTTDKTMCKSALVDQFFRNDELEYFTADSRNYIITGLCVSITDLPSAKIPVEPKLKGEE